MNDAAYAIAAFAGALYLLKRSKAASTEITCDNGGCALLNRYDTDGDGKFGGAEIGKANDDFQAGLITAEELEFVMGAWTAGSINAACPGCYAPSAAAKGEIVNLDYPASVKHGMQFDVDASTKNTGGSTGTFRMELHVDGVLKSALPSFTLAAGATSTDKIGITNAPSSGTSMACVVKCIRIA